MLEVTEAEFWKQVHSLANLLERDFHLDPGEAYDRAHNVLSNTRKVVD